MEVKDKVSEGGRRWERRVKRTQVPRRGVEGRIGVGKRERKDPGRSVRLGT